MPGMAVQHAPKSAGTSAPNTQGQRERTPKQETKAKVPQAAGIAGMIVMIALALPVGNFRALSSATPKDFLRQGAVKSIVEDRLDEAQNAMTVARRAELGGNLYADVDEAISQMRKAKNARELSRADQKLISAVSEMSAEAKGRLDKEGQTMLTRAVDDFTEQGNFLRQEARSFNQKAEKAQKVYESLPTKFLFSEPDHYEGI